MSCRRDFCRECATEHEGRMICGACLEHRVEGADAGGRRFVRLKRILAILSGVVLAWMSFYLLGQALLFLPDQFHGVRAALEPESELEASSIEAPARAESGEP